MFCHLSVFHKPQTSPLQKPSSRFPPCSELPEVSLLNITEFRWPILSLSVSTFCVRSVLHFVNFGFPGREDQRCPPLPSRVSVLWFLPPRAGTTITSWRSNWSDTTAALTGALLEHTFTPLAPNITVTYVKLIWTYLDWNYSFHMLRAFVLPNVDSWRWGNLLHLNS